MTSPEDPEPRYHATRRPGGLRPSSPVTAPTWRDGRRARPAAALSRLRAELAQHRPERLSEESGIVEVRGVTSGEQNGTYAEQIGEPVGAANCIWGTLWVPSPTGSGTFEARIAAGSGL